MPPLCNTGSALRATALKQRCYLCYNTLALTCQAAQFVIGPVYIERDRTVPLFRAFSVAYVFSVRRAQSICLPACFEASAAGFPEIWE